MQTRFAEEKTPLAGFTQGLVFGFDVGTGSIGWAVRRGTEFLDVGVLICPEDTNDLESRRKLRRQRRTLRSKQYRRQWFAGELAGLLGLKLIKLDGGKELPLPESAWRQNQKGGWVPKPGFETLLEPGKLRLRACGDPKHQLQETERAQPLTAEELFTALTHLFRRRGYTKVPWASSADTKARDDEADPEEDAQRSVLKDASDLLNEMRAYGFRYPCQLLSVRAEEQAVWAEAAKQAEAQRRPFPEPLAELWATKQMRGELLKQQPLQRKARWPRESLLWEFAAACRTQAPHFPALAKKAMRKRLLFGKEWDAQSRTGLRPLIRNGRKHYVYFKDGEGRQPGVLGLRWPRFENRGPALDAFTPVDAAGRPLHVVRKNKEAFHLAQWELAVLNFRVIEVATGALVIPEAKALVRLREMWESSRRKPRGRKAALTIATAKAESSEVRVTKSVLGRWAGEFSARYRLVEGQPELTPQTGAGRARFASPTLDRLREMIASGARPDTAQPVLRRPGECAESALNRYLADIKHPLVRHRLVLFSRLLAKLAKRFGQPDLIVLEAVRSLALSEKNKREHIQKQHDNREERSTIRKELVQDGFNSSNTAVLRYRLFKEAKGRCPLCLCPFCLQEVVFQDAEIEHIVPRTRVDSNAFSNLTVAHRDCNQQKNNRTPWEAFGATPEWEALRKNAEACFGLGSLKYRLFTNADAENLIEQKADLQHTAYIARVIRHVALLQLGWLGEDGRDPTPEKQNPALRFQVTNGQLTSRLRNAWALNQILHRLPPANSFDHLSEEERKQKWESIEELTREKNRGDLRHHALDAMVIACTLPWLAHRTVGATDPHTGEHGWWKLDEKERSKAANPIFPKEGALRRAAEEWMKKVIVRHHASRSNHQQGYNKRLYGQRQDAFVIREPLARLGPDDLPNLWPPELANYCSSAWRKFVSETPDLDGLLKRTKGCLPDAFITRLCFSHFQSWREKGMAEFSWPAAVRVPVRRARVVGSKDRSGFLRVGTGFIERKSFREVRICRSVDGLRFVPVFVPFHQHDTPTAAEPFDKETPPVAILRKGALLTLRKALGPAAPPGRYILHELSRGTPMLLPPHVAGIGVPAAAFGLAKSGLKPRWNTLIKALGYELPHPPSAEPRPAGPDQAGPVAH